MPDDRFAGRPDDERLFERLPANAKSLLPFLQLVMRDDCTLHRKAFHVLGLFSQEAHGNQQRKVRVDVARRLEAPVQLPLDRFPDRIPFGPDCHAALDWRVVRELRGLNHVEIPLGIILCAGFDVLGHRGFVGYGLIAEGQRGRRWLHVGS